MLPELAGGPIRVQLKRSLGPHLAAASIPRRVILLDAAVLRSRGDFERILVHEIFHFVWVRLGNPVRWDWERLLAAELRGGARGELGWSAEWRKQELTATDRRTRSPRWRRYACESFCDTAAWCFAELNRHSEFTLQRRYRAGRWAWFQQLTRKNQESGARVRV